MQDFEEMVLISENLVGLPFLDSQFRDQTLPSQMLPESHDPHPAQQVPARRRRNHGPIQVGVEAMRIGSQAGFFAWIQPSTNVWTLICSVSHSARSR